MARSFRRIPCPPVWIIPSVGPEHATLHDTGRVEYTSINDDEALDAFHELSHLEGIIPALESAHAIAQAKKLHAAGRSDRAS